MYPCLTSEDESIRFWRSQNSQLYKRIKNIKLCKPAEGACINLTKEAQIYSGSKKGQVYQQPALCCNAFQDNLQELHLVIPLPTSSALPSSSRRSQLQVRDQSTSLTAACRAQLISQPLCTAATGLFYQPAHHLVPLTARTSQLEARECDKAGLGDGEREGKYWGGELKGSSMGRKGFIAAMQDTVHKNAKDQA